jgi:hypothetical protein
MSEQERAQAIASVSQAVLASLGGIEEAAGAAASAATAEMMVRLSIIHMLNRIGPQAAKAALVRVYADLETDIASQNAAATVLS